MKTYYIRFGSTNPSAFSGLTPTLTVFAAGGVTAVTAPPVTEGPAGSGIYHFSYGPTMSMMFVCDGGATLSSINRYIVGALDPVDAVDEAAAAIGATLSGMGVTLAQTAATVGAAGDAIGSNVADPASIFGFVKRLREFLEGNAVFTKLTGSWQLYDRSGATLLATKTLTNGADQATKT